MQQPKKTSREMYTKNTHNETGRKSLLLKSRRAGRVDATDDTIIRNNKQHNR